MVDLHLLNPEQRLAVQTINGPVLILAGAGTGKTRVITFRIAHMIDQGIPPSHILGVTFTNKAAREMKARVAQLVPRSWRHPDAPRHGALTLSTFHSFGARVLREYIDRLGYKKNFVVYNESEQLGVIRKILSRISAKGNPSDPQAVLSLLSRHRNGGIPAAVAADEGLAAMADHVRARYEAALRACNAVDFDDLLLLTLKLWTEQPEVLAACRARFRYVMVDEYQDTNAAQFQLVHLLTCEHRHLCVVGDDDQSIYGWRGAEISNLLNMEKYFPEVKIIKLEQNYRSTTTILNAANALIRHNLRRHSKQLWSRQGQGKKIALFAFPNEEEEARTLVEQIECDRLVRRIPWSAQAVLFRTNIQSRPLETALRQAGVRYHLVGGQSFFDRREVKDLMAYLKVLVNPHDDNSLARIANVPARGLSETTMQRLLAASQEHHRSVFAAMGQAEVQAALGDKTRACLRSFVDWIERTRSLLASGQDFLLQPWAEQFLTEIGYFAELRRVEKNPETAESRLRNLQDLLATLDQDRPGHRTAMERLEAALEELVLDEDRLEEKQTQSDAVTLITMHSCKGLEFPHVRLAGLEDGLLPHARAQLEGTLDEERRLFYVALTRARLTLTLSHCQARKKFGQLRPCHPSPFLAELPPDLVERADQTVSPPVAPGEGTDLFAALRAALE